MDPLSGVAGGIALLQLLESIAKIVELGRSIRKAPANVTALFSDLELLASAVRKAQNVLQSVNLDGTSEKVLENCEKKVTRFLHQIEQAVVHVKSPSLRVRTWSSLKLTLKKKEIESLQQEIESAKLTLALVQGTLSFEFINSIDIKQQELLAVSLSLRQFLQETKAKAKAENLKQVEETMRDPQYLSSLVYPEVPRYECPKTYRLRQGNAPHESVKNQEISAPNIVQKPRNGSIQSRQCQTHWSRKIPTPSFAVKVTSRTYDVITARNDKTRKSTEAETNYIITPNFIGRMLGISRGVSVTARSIAGWKYSIQTFRSVSNDALIFEFCRDGNLAAVRSLIKRGDASAWDRDPQGRTPLWYAAEALHIELAQLLLEEGADPHADDFRHRRGPIIAAVASKDINIQPKLAMINMLQTYTRDDFDDDTYLHVMGVSMLAYRPQKAIKMSWSERREAMTQMFSTLLPQFHPTHPGLAKLLHDSIKFYYEKDVLQRLLCVMKGSIDVANPAQSVVYEAIKTRLLERDPKSMTMIMRRSERLHTKVKKGEIVDENGRKVPEFETPTMLAMYDMKTFLIWRRALKELGHDIKTFVRDELENGLLAQQGWSDESLTLLFDSDLEQVVAEHSGPSKFGFPMCQRCGNEGTQLGAALKVDLCWRRCLREIRLNKTKFVTPRKVQYSVEVAEDLNITIAIGGDGDDSQVMVERQRTTTVTVAKIAAQDLAWPYRVVCSTTCTDGVCVAWAFEDDSKVDEDNLFPPFPFKGKSEEEKKTMAELVSEEIVEACPTRGMPGAFVH